jgi:hypothetical protein
MTIYDPADRPDGSNADEWLLFLEERLDNRANCPNGLTFMAVQIAEAIDKVKVRAEKAEACVKEMRKEVRDAYRDGLAEGFER